MWHGIFIIGAIASLIIIILYSALVAASEADKQAEKFLIKESKNG